MNDIAAWHSIRPWRPKLALSIRELTSVSVTFILSSPYTSESIVPLSMSHDEEESGSEDDCDQDTTQIISDVLAKGLSVKVNGIPWQRVLIKIDEETDEAVIILFGLMPGRQYDVELGVVPGERGLRRQITTDSEIHSDSSRPDPLVESAATLSSSLASSPSQALPASPAHTSPSSSPTVAVPMPTPAPLTLEVRRQQLSHDLAALNAEHAQLSAALKTARKEAQRADAGLRAEIDALKRAAERGAAGEHRAKQKVLALREARKQTEAAAEAMEEATKEVESVLPRLEQQIRDVEETLQRVRLRAQEKRREREDVENAEKRRREGWGTELGALGRTLEKLETRREKLEGSGEGGGTVSELEDRLRRLQEERERIERDPFGYEGEAGGKDGTEGSQENDDPVVEPDGRPLARQDHQSVGSQSSQGHHAHSHHNTTDSSAPSHHHHSHHHARKRHSHPHTHQPPHHPALVPPRAAGRKDAPQVPTQSQTVPPIQRPAHGARLSLPSHRELSAGPGVIHLQAPATTSSHSQKSGRPHGSGHSGRAHSNSGSGSTSASGGSSAASSPAPAAGGSNLSSRAPPFEPSGLGLTIGTRNAQSTSLAASKSDLNPGSNAFSPRSAAVRPRGGST